jgi:diadenosine tetraphosphate (Ap4A) HIT family hydrolase
MTMDGKKKACELCTVAGGEVIHEEEKLRVVLVDDAQYPGFCRVIWNAHVQEMTDLAALDRILFMDAVWQTESAIREVMHPDKVNVASLGNVVPHLHWHVIPRYTDDMHFPGPVWAQVQRTLPEEVLSERRELLTALRQALKSRFADVV